jgi:hypothetical protein
MRLNHPSAIMTRCGLALILSASLCRAATTNLAAVSDTSLHSAFSDLNFGGGTTFTVGGRNMGGQARALIRFNIAAHLPAGATVNSATLTLTVNNANGPNSTFDLHRALAEWGEGGGDPNTGAAALEGEATWNHRLSPESAWSSAGGDYHGTPSASQAVAGLGSYAFSASGMAADVQMWLNNPASNFGWLLRSQAETTLGTIRRFAGRAGLGAPQLAINYSLSGPPPALPPVLSGPVQVGNEIRFSFNAQSNRTYAIEFRDTLGVTNWGVLTNIPALPADATIQVTTGVTGSERYFRARTP